jgi:ABC-type antimicrobial peptide transport system permease subunit
MHVGRSLDNWAIGGKLLSCFAALGLSLAGLGLYGVISGFVVRRTGEIGTRMALGAALADVLWLVLGRGLRLSLTGTLFGLIGAFYITRALALLMPELPPSNPWVLVMVAGFLMGVAFIACWLPARRAARMDPMVALRNE